MKKVILLLPAFIIYLTTYAQTSTDKPWPVYGYVSLGYAHPHTWRKALEIVSPKGFSGAVFQLSRYRESPDKPGNYQSLQTFGGFKLSSGVEDKLKMRGFTLGKAWWMGQSSLSRFHLKAGLTFNSLDRPVNFRPKAPGFLVFTNYDFDRKKERFTGFVFQPSLELALTRWVGFSVSWYMHRNKYWNFSGFEASLHVGFLRDKYRVPKEQR